MRKCSSVGKEKKLSENCQRLIWARITRRGESVKHDIRRKKQQIGQGREKGGNSDGTIFSLHGGEFIRIACLLSSPPSQEPAVGGVFSLVERQQLF